MRPELDFLDLPTPEEYLIPVKDASGLSWHVDRKIHVQKNGKLLLIHLGKSKSFAYNMKMVSSEIQKQFPLLPAIHIYFLINWNILKLFNLRESVKFRRNSRQVGKSTYWLELLWLTQIYFS